MERLTVRKHDYVLLKKDGQLIPPINMSGQEIRLVMERLAELEDAIEQGKLVPVVRCGECKYIREFDATSGYYCDWKSTDRCDFLVFLNDFCNEGKRKPETKICITEDCPYQKGNPCEAAEGCGGYEGAE